MSWLVVLWVLAGVGGLLLLGCAALVVWAVVSVVREHRRLSAGGHRPAILGGNNAEALEGIMQSDDEPYLLWLERDTWGREG